MTKLLRSPGRFYKMIVFCRLFKDHLSRKGLLDILFLKNCFKIIYRSKDFSAFRSSKMSQILFMGRRSFHVDCGNRKRPSLRMIQRHFMGRRTFLVNCGKRKRPSLQMIQRHFMDRKTFLVNCEKRPRPSLQLIQ